MDYIAIQTADFDLSAEYQSLIQGSTGSGAVVLFTGIVRDFNQGEQVLELELEHYPVMAEHALQSIIAKARALGPGQSQSDPQGRKTWTV